MCKYGILRNIIISAIIYLNEFGAFKAEFWLPCTIPECFSFGDILPPQFFAAKDFASMGFGIALGMLSC